ncbi:MAG: LrgB family protein [Lawsonibacter sp.]|nr:LrgB family protein [Lawsonibacter sp.]MCI9655154.1 LrgB family protein [Lawsonibacter sp.]MDE6899408.1 LrgB family protein [Lawsonibacter sp.]
MADTLLSSPFLGLFLSAAAWCAGCWLQKKTGLLLCNPLLIAAALIIAALSLLRIPYESYALGGDFIKLMLGPVTAVLALNIYNQRDILRENFLPVLAGCLAGSLTSVGSVLLLCRLFRVEETLTASLLPKSVTTAIAIGVAESQGGVGGIAAAAVIITGLIGAVLAPLFARVFHVTQPVAEGLAIGACSHALGTARAMEIGQVQGAMSSIAICVCGIMTSVLALFL